MGQLHVSIVPCKENGDENIDSIDDPKMLLGHSLDFKVKISHASGLPDDFCQDMRCYYWFDGGFTIDGRLNQFTKSIKGKNKAPCFDYVKQHRIECVTQEVLDFM